MRPIRAGGLVGASHHDIRAWLGTLVGKRERSSVARKLSTLRTFYRFLIRKGYRDDNPAALVSYPRIGERLTAYLTVDDVFALLSLPDRTTPAGKRDAAILELLYSTGIRVGELMALNAPDISWDESVRAGNGEGKEGTDRPDRRPRPHEPPALYEARTPGGWGVTGIGDRCRRAFPQPAGRAADRPERESDH